MRHLVLLLTLLLASLGLAATARALPTAAGTQPLAPLSAAEEEADGEVEADEGVEADEEIDATEEAEFAEIEREACQQEELFCEDDEEIEEAERCVLEGADAFVSTSADGGKVRVTIRYSAFTPATFTLDYSLRGGKGGLHLGSARTQFQRSGVFRDTLTVSPRKTGKVRAARQFVVELHPVGTGGNCSKRLSSGAPHRSRRRHRAGA